MVHIGATVQVLAYSAKFCNVLIPRMRLPKESELVDYVPCVVRVLFHHHILSYIVDNSQKYSLFASYISSSLPSTTQNATIHPALTDDHVDAQLPRDTGLAHNPSDTEPRRCDPGTLLHQPVSNLSATCFADLVAYSHPSLRDLGFAPSAGVAELEGDRYCKARFPRGVHGATYDSHCMRSRLAQLRDSRDRDDGDTRR